MKRRDYLILFALGFILFIGAFSVSKSAFTGSVITGGVVDDELNLSPTYSNDDAVRDFQSQRDLLREEVSERIRLVAGEGVENSTKDFVVDFVSGRGIRSDQIMNISLVDLNSLPNHASIDNVNDANLAIYNVKYNEDNAEESVFVVVYSLNELEDKGDLIFLNNNKNILVYGSNMELSGEGMFLQSTGVEGSLENGYTMIRKGSITAISSSMNLISGSDEDVIEVVIYKNGEPMSFGNSFSLDSKGLRRDYDLQSEGIIKFLPGDVISVYVRSSSGSNQTIWKDVVTLIEISTQE